MALESAADLALVIKLIFDKALTEPSFGSVYADLCVAGAEKFPEFENEIDPTKKPITFKRLLLNRQAFFFLSLGILILCQEEFEAEKNIDVEGLEEKEANVKKAMAKKRVRYPYTHPNIYNHLWPSYEEANVKKAMAKKLPPHRALGNIRFIGELYKKKMLAEKIMHECLIKLLGAEEDCPNEEVDLQKAAKGLDARHRFMLQDIVSIARDPASRTQPTLLIYNLNEQLRKDNWKLKGALATTAVQAKTIAEVHQERCMFVYQEHLLNLHHLVAGAVSNISTVGNGAV
ncbi:armadillo-type protein [Pavlovales sp. CCMP2436]|nr:armadillo-type protein [Pavlovales sp. CCMP2436]